MDVKRRGGIGNAVIKGLGTGQVGGGIKGALLCAAALGRVSLGIGPPEAEFA